jgi:hypothetical protein
MIHTRSTETLECVIADVVSKNISQKLAVDKINNNLNIDISRSALSRKVIAAKEPQTDNEQFSQVEDIPVIHLLNGRPPLHD